MVQRVNWGIRGVFIFKIILCSLGITFVFLWAAFFYLPSSFSSTNPLAEINGKKFETIRADKLVEDALFHPNHHHKSIPRPQFGVKYKTEPSKFVKPLDNRYRSNGAMSAKFRSLVPRKLQMWYDDHQGGLRQGHLTLGQETTTNTYVGHVFYFTDFFNKDVEYGRFEMNPDQVFYVIEDPNSPPPKDLADYTKREIEFNERYFAEKGFPWRHYYGVNGPRPPPKLFMWPAKTIGEVHSVTSAHGHWLCNGNPDECLSLDPVHLELEVISLAPRAFVIEGFLNDFEASEIVRLANPSLHHSEVGDTETGNFESDTRTSQNTWLPRQRSPVTETLYRRAADLLQIDEKHLMRSVGAEDMQVVHYVNGQKYDSHHDWGVSGYPESRFLTLLLYLNDMAAPDAGGETSFPKAADGRGIKVHPGKGNAVLFYDLLEDGNADELSLHAALPVRIGEKWLANFWVWDPKIHR